MSAVALPSLPPGYTPIPFSSSTSSTGVKHSFEAGRILSSPTQVDYVFLDQAANRSIYIAPQTDGTFSVKVGKLGADPTKNPELFADVTSSPEYQEVAKKLVSTAKTPSISDTGIGLLTDALASLPSPDATSSLDLSAGVISNAIIDSLLTVKGNKGGSDNTTELLSFLLADLRKIMNKSSDETVKVQTEVVQGHQKLQQEKRIEQEGKQAEAAKKAEEAKANQKLTLGLSIFGALIACVMVIFIPGGGVIAAIAIVGAVIGAVAAIMSVADAACKMANNGCGIAAMCRPGHLSDSEINDKLTKGQMTDVQAKESRDADTKADGDFGYAMLALSIASMVLTMGPALIAGGTKIFTKISNLLKGEGGGGAGAGEAGALAAGATAAGTNAARTSMSAAQTAVKTTKAASAVLVDTTETASVASSAGRATLRTAGRVAGDTEEATDDAAGAAVLVEKTADDAADGATAAATTTKVVETAAEEGSAVAATTLKAAEKASRASRSRLDKLLDAVKDEWDKLQAALQTEKGQKVMNALNAVASIEAFISSVFDFITSLDTYQADMKQAEATDLKAEGVELQASLTQLQALFGANTDDIKKNLSIMEGCIDSLMAGVADNAQVLMLLSKLLEA